MLPFTSPKQQSRSLLPRCQIRWKFPRSSWLLQARLLQSRQRPSLRGEQTARLHLAEHMERQPISRTCARPSALVEKYECIKMLFADDAVEFNRVLDALEEAGTFDLALHWLGSTGRRRSGDWDKRGPCRDALPRQGGAPIPVSMLTVVPTPIGNLGDFTPTRHVEAIEAADFVLGRGHPDHGVTAPPQRALRRA